MDYSDKSSNTTFVMSQAVIKLVRHGEKYADSKTIPDPGTLDPRGYRRAAAYAKYFSKKATSSSDTQQVEEVPQYLAATLKGSVSDRPFETLDPLSDKLSLDLHHDLADEDYQDLADSLIGSTGVITTKKANQVLVCWHHGKMPNLVRALGGDPDTLFGTPDDGKKGKKGKKKSGPGIWPENCFDREITLTYNFTKTGKVKFSKQSFQQLLLDEDKEVVTRKDHQLIGCDVDIDPPPPPSTRGAIAPRPRAAASLKRDRLDTKTSKLEPKPKKLKVKE